MKKYWFTFVDILKSFTMYSITCWEYGGRHYCWTYAEALDWMAQYPADAMVYIRHFDILVCRRNGTVAA